MVNSAGVRIFRSPDIWMDRNRLYKVVVDGKTVGELWPKENGFFNLAPGEHRLFVKIDFMRSKELSIAFEPGETVELACRGGGSALALFRTIFRRSAYLDLHEITPEERETLAVIAKQRTPPAPRNLKISPDSSDSTA